MRRCDVKYEQKRGNITKTKVKCANCGYEDTLDRTVTPVNDNDDDYDDDEDDEDEDDDE
jgi:hypothetical protein